VQSKCGAQVDEKSHKVNKQTIKETINQSHMIMIMIMMREFYTVDEILRSLQN
jgi:hypothetical protein